MVTRYYICNNCNYEFTLSESIQDPPKRKCPQCHKLSLFQDLVGQIHILVKEPTTLLQQAERNTKEMGKYELQSKRKETELRKLRGLKKIGKIPEDATEVPKPWYAEVK